MKIVFPGIQKVFDTNMDMVNTLIIENQQIFYNILSELQDQIEGADGAIVLSENRDIISVAKNVEVISQFIPFTLSRKKLISKLNEALEQRALQEDYESTIEIIGMMENYLAKLAFGLVGDIEFTKVNVSAIIKAIGAGFCEEYATLSEKIIDYMELVTEYDSKKLFIFVNLRSYILDSEAQLFVDTVRQHGYEILFLESHESTILKGEARYLIDTDCCEIQ